MLDQAFHTAEGGCAFPESNRCGGRDGCALAAYRTGFRPTHADRQHSAKAAAHLPRRDRMPRKGGQSGVENFLDKAMFRQAAGDALRTVACGANAGKSVRIPRVSSHASKGPSTPPICARIALIRSHSGDSSRVLSVPAITSECPFRYLVAECITMSAPSSKGRVSTGVATVESTATRAPAACAISQVAAMSVIVHSGFAGVSIQISLILPGLERAPYTGRCRSCR